MADTQYGIRNTKLPKAPRPPRLLSAATGRVLPEAQAHPPVRNAGVKEFFTLGGEPETRVEGHRRRLRVEEHLPEAQGPRVRQHCVDQAGAPPPPPEFRKQR